MAVRGGWWIIDEPELHFDDEIVVPDLAGWRRERMPEYPDTAYFTLAPDWVCEALSASTRKVGLHEKRPIYALAGVPHLWLVDPIDRALEAFELHDGQWLLIASAKDDDPGEHPSVRCDHLQPWRPLALRGARTATCLIILSRANRDAGQPCNLLILWDQEIGYWLPERDSMPCSMVFYTVQQYMYFQ